LLTLTQSPVWFIDDVLDNWVQHAQFSDGECLFSRAELNQSRASWHKDVQSITFHLVKLCFGVRKIH